jgi:hypothetical protein
MIDELDDYIDSKNTKPESLVPGVTWDAGLWKVVKKGTDVRWFKNRIKAEEYANDSI